MTTDADDRVMLALRAWFDDEQNILDDADGEDLARWKKDMRAALSAAASISKPGLEAYRLWYRKHTGKMITRANAERAIRSYLTVAFPESSK